MRELNSQSPDDRPHWMVINESEELLLLFQDIFGRLLEVDIECFNSAQDAQAVFESYPAAFEFVITDLEMPDAGNGELCRRLRAFSPLLKILFLAADEILSENEAREKGFATPLQKPFPFYDLQAALEPAILEFPAPRNGGGEMMLAA